MANDFFHFKQFTIFQGLSAFKVGTDGVLLGASAEISNVHKILDIGAGTGLISMMLAQRSDAAIVSIEPDCDSFLQLEQNISAGKWPDRITVINTDLQGYRPEDEKFDLIITNPPFFRNSIRNSDQRISNSRHDDTLPAADLLSGVIALLEEDGLFQLILPYAEGTIFIAEASEYGLICNSIVKIRPLPTSPVRRLILTFSRHKKDPVEKFLTIEHGKRHEFTEDYINLTKDFYLKF